MTESTRDIAIRTETKLDTLIQQFKGFSDCVPGLITDVEALKKEAAERKAASDKTSRRRWDVIALAIGELFLLIGSIAPTWFVRK